jgi:hypothetical protein
VKRVFGKATGPQQSRMSSRLTVEDLANGVYSKSAILYGSIRAHVSIAHVQCPFAHVCLLNAMRLLSPLPPSHLRRFCSTDRRWFP